MAAARAALALVLAGLLWPALAPLARAAGWSTLVAASASWWFKGALPVALTTAAVAQP